jgi:hypothetical protein
MDYELYVGKWPCCSNGCKATSTGFVSHQNESAAPARSTAYHCDDHKDEAEETIDRDYWRDAEIVTFDTPAPYLSIS